MLDYGVTTYKQLSFGISSAAEVFQNTLCTALEGLRGVRNISDDIVFGQNREEHDKNFEAVFKHLNEKHVTLNKDKCKPKLNFMDIFLVQREFPQT
jgi:hypothetical protein